MARLLLGDSLRKTADRWPIVQQATWAVEAFLFGTFLRIAQVLPADSVAALSRRTLKWLGPKQPKNRIVRRNLQLAFPDKTEEEINVLAGEVWGNSAGRTHLLLYRPFYYFYPGISENP